MITPPRLLLAATVFLLAACSSSENTENQEPIQQAQATSAHVAQLVIGMANPASVNCTRAGGRLTLASQLDGSTLGMCQLPNGKQCEEWALMRGACPTR